MKECISLLINFSKQNLLFASFVIISLVLAGIFFGFFWRDRKYQKGHQTNSAQKVLIAVIVIFLIFTSLNFALRVGAIQEQDKYELLIDLLGILLTLVGIAGAGVYLFIRTKIMENVEKERNLSRAENYLNTAYSLWHTYEQTQRINKDLLDKIIKKAESAIKFTECLDENTKRKHEESICNYKNDLAYYLAERKNPEDKERVRAYLEDVMKKRKDYPRCAYEWTDTYEFAKKQFPDIKIFC